jgi:hypothetical protein
MHDELTAAIARDLGIEALSIEEQRTLISQFGEIALKAATMALAEKLDPSRQEEFMKLAEAGDAKALQEFLDREVPGHEALARAAVAEEVRRFKEFQKP